MITKFNLSEKEIQSNYKEFIKFIEDTFTGDRKKKLLKMYDEDNLGLSVATSPASTTSWFHYSFPGGYILHIMNVIKNSFGQKKLFEMTGGKPDWTDEEQIFSCCHHVLASAETPHLVIIMFHRMKVGRLKKEKIINSILICHIWM